METLISKAIKNPKAAASVLLSKMSFLPDKTYLKIKYRLEMGKKLNLENPQTFNEKLQWLKVYNRKPEYTMMVDKYSVREYIKGKIGEDYLIPLLGAWEKWEDIDFGSLPNEFVLKCSHDSGSVVICRDKKIFDFMAAKKKITRKLKMNLYSWGREWVYKDVKPRIIAEKYMVDKTGQFIDYKFMCFGGYVSCVMVCIDRNIGDTKFYFFDKDWNLLRLNKRGKEAPKDFTLPKPKGMDKMFEIAETLSAGLPFSRIDLYECDGKIYFGEITFFPQSGFDANLLKDTDKYFGDLIDLKGV